MSVGFWQIILVVLLVVLLFGRGKISDLMGDVAKGIRSFKKGLNEDDDKPKALRDDSAKSSGNGQDGNKSA
ncbi:MAG: twin-arginine translocase TatA/TatE family subunit [Proteobacteria bacterium]|nr:MAG: twin-arginine translocase TatA/TatE family subunit [Pseudomonadota bacterium]